MKAHNEYEIPLQAVPGRGYPKPPPPPAVMVAMSDPVPEPGIGPDARAVIAPRPSITVAHISRHDNAHKQILRWRVRRDVSTGPNLCSLSSVGTAGGDHPA